MTEKDFLDWPSAYSAAWDARDADAFTQLFSDDAQYYSTPFKEPKIGRSLISLTFWEAVKNQRDVHFDPSILNVEDEKSLTNWRCTFKRTAESVFRTSPFIYLTHC